MINRYRAMDFITSVRLQQFKKGQTFALASMQDIRIFKLVKIEKYHELALGTHNRTTWIEKLFSVKCKKKNK